ncbi:MAG: phage holin family protein [Acidobacteriota bacterium]|nr:phage holin family protein [Acidobacteriota bacterium]
MKNRLGELSENASALGEAGLGLMKAEAAALSQELRLSGKALFRIGVLAAISLFVLFWALAALVYAGIEIGTIWLPRWASALTASAILLLIVVLVTGVVWIRVRRLETPVATLRRHMDDHRDWWRRRIAGRRR